MFQSRIPLERVFKAGAKPESTSSASTGNNNKVSISFSPTSIMSLPQQALLGARTPQMLEYERQAEERAKEQDRMQEERDRMLDEMQRMTREADRIAQEEYEMKQFYEAEALKHAEELRLHQDEIRRHQERVRDHERKVRDHEASAEAFAKVIAMPAKPGRERQISFMSPTPGGLKRTGTNGTGSSNGT